MNPLPNIGMDAAFRKCLRTSKTVLFVKLDRSGRIQRMNGTAEDVLSRFGEPMGEDFAQYVAGLETFRVEDLIARFRDSDTGRGALLELGTKTQSSLAYRFIAEPVSDGYLLFGEPSPEATRRLCQETARLRDGFAEAMRRIGRRSLEGHRLGRVLREAEEHLERHARVDPLTNLPNRRAFLRELRREFRRFARYGRTYSVTLAEIRGLEAVTDAAGLAAEEAATVMVGEVLKTCLRASDCVARFGDRRFAVLQYETPGDTARTAEQRIRETVASAGIAAPDGGILALAVASAEIAGDDDHPENALRRADAALRDGDRSTPSSAEQPEKPR